MSAELLIRRRVAYGDGTSAELVLWRVPTPVQPSSHIFKYRLVYSVAGERLIGFDNERGKGDHRHEGGHESLMSFVTSMRYSTTSWLPSSDGEPSMAKLEIEVGRDLRAAAAEVAATWKVAIAGEPVEASDKVVFVDWRTLCAVLTADRYDLLRAIARAPVSDVSDLARALGRETWAIDADVEALVNIGLMMRDETGVLSTAVDEIASTIRIAA